MINTISNTDLINLIGRSYTEEDNVARREIDATIENLQKQPNFSAALLGLICDVNVPEGVRISSSTLIKTIVCRYWNEREGYIIENSEKGSLRRDL